MSEGIIKDLKVRYYYWEQDSNNSWRPLGSLYGYPSLKELKKENKFNMEQTQYPHKHKILKAKVIETGEVKV